MASDEKLKRLLGGGAARKAGEDTDLKQKYDREATEKMTRGGSMPSFEEWKRRRENRNGSS